MWLRAMNGRGFAENLLIFMDYRLDGNAVCVVGRLFQGVARFLLSSERVLLFVFRIEI
jgi:hypothetical protein